MYQINNLRATRNLKQFATTTANDFKYSSNAFTFDLYKDLSF